MAKKKQKAASSEPKKSAKKEKSESKDVKEKKVAKKAPKRKSRSKKDAEDTRKRLFWGVFNHALKRVALFSFNQKKAALKRAEELSEGEKPPHFVQKVKTGIDEEVAVTE